MRSLKHRSVSASLLVGVLTLACSERAEIVAPPNTPTNTQMISSSASAGVISRFADVVGDFLIDENRQLSAMIGRSYETVVSVCTTGIDDPDTGLVQVVERPNGGFNVLVRAKEVNILVWDQVLPPDNCDLFLANPPFAAGTGRMSLRALDPGTSGNGASNFGVRYVGTVTNAATGQRYHFLFTGHILVTASGQVHFSGGEIKLKPIGG
jgi:hypothetical protein